MVEQLVEGIPTVLVEPRASNGRPVVLWMSHLGGSTEQARPMLDRFAAGGHPAVSFDAVGHGGRGAGDPWEFASEVLSAFRTRMWPLLGQTTLEATRVLDWAQHQTGRRGSVLAGGVSMGGDVAIALAGIDSRVRRVATVGSTPNWRRPGMRDLQDPSMVVDQGEADAYAQWYADRLDPSRNLERYRGRPAIAFELGDSDRHIPVENARTFAREAQEGEPVPRDRIRIQTYSGLDHIGVTSSDSVLAVAADWLIGTA